MNNKYNNGYINIYNSVFTINLDEDIHLSLKVIRDFYYDLTSDGWSRSFALSFDDNGNLIIYLITNDEKFKNTDIYKEQLTILKRNNKIKKIMNKI